MPSEETQLELEVAVRRADMGPAAVVWPEVDSPGAGNENHVTHVQGVHHLGLSLQDMLLESGAKITRSMLTRSKLTHCGCGRCGHCHSFMSQPQGHARRLTVQVRCGGGGEGGGAIGGAISRWLRHDPGVRELPGKKELSPRLEPKRCMCNMKGVEVGGVTRDYTPCGQGYGLM